MANYVKFQRGSQAAYNKLLNAVPSKVDENTLYFIYPDSADTGSVGKLYLGSRLISGGDIVLSAATLNDLKDVITQDVAANSFLVSETVIDADGVESVVWKNKTLDEVVELIKSSLGDLASSANVFQTTLTADDADHLAAINRVIPENTTLTAGDIAIIKALIANDKYQHTAYVYDGSNWTAMDGNYSAETVYFDEDLVTTTAIGNITLSGGQAVIPSKGSNLIDLFNTLYVNEIKTDLKTGDPAANLTGSITYYQIGTTGTKDVTVSLSSDGEYKYGYSTDPKEPTEGTAVTSILNDTTTGVVVDTSKESPYTLTLNGTSVAPKTAGGAIFTLAPAAKTAKGTMSATGAVYHTQGGVPVSNLKKAYPAQRIGAGNVSKTVEEFRWYVPFFQGFTYDADAIADPANITEAQLTTLNAPSAGTSTVAKVVNADAYSAKKLTTATAAKSWRQYFLAYPSTYNYVMSGAKDGNNIDCTVLKANDVTINYGTEEAPNNVTYTVYYINNAAAYDTLKISWNI